MFSRSFIKRRKTKLTRRTRSGNPGSSLQYNSLEDRRLLAVNLELLSATLIDGTQTPITSPNIGERVYLRAVWNTTDLPANTTYNIGFEVNGVELQSGNTTAGSGIPNGFGYRWFRSGWFTVQGNSDVTVTADINDVVVEDDEQDNEISFSFTSQTANPPVTLAWPTDGIPNVEHAVSNYVDNDPTGGFSDFNGQNATYNGHNAFDSGPFSFAAMDAGTSLYAAAGGTVVATNDGEFDRQTAGFNQNPLPTANYVIIDHGSGYETFYWHLRRDSVSVEVGDVVSKGDFIGYMGSSGISTGLHVHFGLRHYGLTVDPMMDQAAYMDTPIDYVFDNSYVLSSGVTNYNPGNHHREGVSQVTEWKQTSGQLAYVWADFSGLESTDQITFDWYRPNGSLWSTGSFSLSQNYSSAWWWYSRNLPSTPDLGTWRVDFLVNGSKKGEQTFDVTPDGATEIRVEDSNGEIVLDNRFTPMDFGEVNLSSADPQMTFTVFNHGFENLETFGFELPDQYYVVEGLAATILPGATDTFTIALDTSVAGYHAGDVRFVTNDADETHYNFSVEGIVKDRSTLTLGISERSTPEGTTVLANVRRFGPTAPLQIVNLSSTSPDVTVPSIVRIPAGSDFVTFQIVANEDFQWDGDVVVEVIATSSGYDDASNEIVISNADVLPVPLGFDIGAAGPQFGTYIETDDTSAYTTAAGFGWLPDLTAPNEFLLQRGDNLTKDGLSLRQGTFVVDVPDGEYNVDVHLGIVKKLDNVLISVEGIDDTFDPAAGPNVVKSYTVTVTDGQLSVFLDGLPGLSNRIIFSGLTINPSNSPAPRPFDNVDRNSIGMAWYFNQTNKQQAQTSHPVRRFPNQDKPESSQVRQDNVRRDDLFANQDNWKTGANEYEELVARVDVFESLISEDLTLLPEFTEPGKQ